MNTYMIQFRGQAWPAYGENAFEPDPDTGLVTRFVRRVRVNIDGVDYTYAEPAMALYTCPTFEELAARLSARLAEMGVV